MAEDSSGPKPKKRSVGLLLMIEGVPGYNSPVALIQRRGAINPEKLNEGKIMESFPGGCQVTAHGKVKEGEVRINALIRETREELGIELLDQSDKRIDMKPVFWKEGEDEDVVTMATVVPANVLKKIRLAASSGGLDFLPEEKLKTVRDLKQLGKDGTPSRTAFAMFSDELEAVKKAYELIRSGELK